MSQAEDRRRAHAPGTHLTRRRLLAGGVVIPLTPLAGAKVIRDEMPWQEGRADAPVPVVQPAGEVRYEFLSPAEVAFVSAATARLIPADDLGPGAIEAGVPFFIDRQLAGEYGRAERWYMQGPWAKGEPTQGYQSRLTPAGLYRTAIREIDAAIAQAHRVAFAGLSLEQQDDWLHRLERGEAPLPSVDAKSFFKQLWQNTLEGFWCYPIHGGNRGMVGWKLIGFPGARYDQRAYVSRHNEKYPLPPVALLGREAWDKG